jgi:hypothetical protein
MHKIDHLLNRVVERKLFRFRHESKIRYALRRTVEEVGPYLLGGVIGLVIVCFIFFGV